MMKDKSIKKKLYNNRLIGLICIFIFSAILVFCYYENNAISISNFTIDVEGENDIKLVQLSDLHSKELGKDNETLISVVLSKTPDAIMFTGDLIHMDGKNIEGSTSLLITLAKSCPVYYIIGNHETRSSKQNIVIDLLKNGGVNVLQNEMAYLKISNTVINILGLDESSNYNESTIMNLLKSLENKNGIKIVLSHYPENYSSIGMNSYKNYDFDIMLSGHAHGGQFRLPFIGGVYAPGQGINPKYYNGMYKENKSTLIVNRGLGNSVFPQRLFNRPDVSVIMIK